MAEEKYLNYKELIELKDQYKLGDNVLSDGEEKGLIEFRENGSIFHVPDESRAYYMIEATVTDYKEIVGAASMTHHLEVVNTGYKEKIEEAISDTKKSNIYTILCIPSGNTVMNPECDDDHPHIICFFSNDSLSLVLNSLRRNPENRKAE